MQVRSFICSLSEGAILHICVSGDVGVGGVCMCVCVSLCVSRCRKGLVAIYMPLSVGIVQKTPCVCGSAHKQVCSQEYMYVRTNTVDMA